jgi:hypothetical protein
MLFALSLAAAVLANFKSGWGSIQPEILAEHDVAKILDIVAMASGAIGG